MKELVALAHSTGLLRMQHRRWLLGGPYSLTFSPFLVVRFLDGEGTSKYQESKRMPRRYYTLELANSSLPLVRRITKDLRDTALEIRQAWERVRAGGGWRGGTCRDDRPHDVAPGSFHGIQRGVGCA